MVLKKEKIQKSKKSKNLHKQRLQPPIISIKSSNLLWGSLASVNELSESLSIVMPNQELLNGYKGVLDLQKSAFEQIENLNGVFKEGAVNFDNIKANIVAPISATIAEIGLATANASQLFNFGKINEPTFLSMQKLSGLCLDAIQGQQGVALSGLQAIKDSENLNSFMTGSVASLQMITNGLDGMIRSVPTFPSMLDLPGLEIIRGKASITEEELSEHQRKLDEFLQEVDPELTEFRLGCWSTFRAKGRDYVGQASSSMRRLVTGVLIHIAPDDKVTNTDYFKNSPEAKTEKGEISWKARIFCATNYDKNKAKHLERLATGLLSAYGNLSAWDHDPLKLHDFVYGFFVAIEGYLLSLLSELKKEE